MATGTETIAASSPGVSRRWLLLDAAVVFLGAFLLFLIQPVYSKFILPWFGGAPLVWATALVFFQSALLAGYAYAHLLVARLNPRRQLAIHCLLLGISLVFLPVAPGEAWKPAGGDAPSWRILTMMVATLGLPYMLLAATSPLVQAWIARYRHQMVPYRLFGLSNLASLLSLLSYPFVIEPALGLDAQFQGWAWGFVLYVAMMAALSGLTARTIRLDDSVRQSPEGVDLQAIHEAIPRWETQILWVALAACPSLLFLATTQHLTQDIAPVPFLWVLPLVLYLLTFVICFEYPDWLPRRLLGLLAVTAATWLGLLVAVPVWITDFRVGVVLFCGGLFVMMLYCHGELYARRPSPAHLTRFYLMTALGGALGGSFVGLLAHRIFDGHYEFFVGLSGCALLVFFREWSQLQRVNRQRGDRFEVTFSTATPLCAAALVASLPFVVAGQPEIRAARNFFGSLRVIEGRQHGIPAWRQLDHGSTKHGLQLLAPGRQCQAVAYYAEDSGVGRMMRMLENRRKLLKVGVIGLGVGTLAAYKRPADDYTFYEINPLIEQIAREDFTYLTQCAQGVDVRLGDARVRMESEAPNGYDALVVDAFSGDSVPTHLLTREAFGMYARHLAATGVVAVNISNRYLDLRPVVRAGGESAGFAVAFLASERDDEQHIFAALWAVLSRDPALLQQRLIRDATGRTPQQTESVAWTDDFSNLFRVLQH